MLDPDRLLAPRVNRFNPSGIRRVLERARHMPDAINLSIGQPDFPVPDTLKRAAIEAIENDHNGYSLSGGVATLRNAIIAWLASDIGWDCGPASGSPRVLVTSGTSGALVTSFLATLGPGDEAIIADPYFVMYPVLSELCEAKSVFCDTYPDFRMTAGRVEPLITDRTRVVLLNSPSNPSGVTLTTQECRDLLELCRARGVLLISDEIYDGFTFTEGRTEPAAGDPSRLCCPSPCRAEGSHDDVLLIRGFGKTYGVTGWRLGFAAGPAWIIDAMAKLQQFTFVCPPTPLQHGAAASFTTDISAMVREYETRRDIFTRALDGLTHVARPDGAFYVFPEVPPALGMSATAFAERLVDDGVLVIPGSPFSRRDTHFRVSLAAPTDQLERAASLIADAMRA
ncbi:MAG: pyridoxal phosphate-dependent aminotransferase [Planctomycetota bacterium]